MKNKWLFRICITLVLIFLYLPIFVVIIFAFNKIKSRTLFTEFTFNWFIELFNDKVIINSLFNSFVLATLASVIATLIGTAAALQIVKMKKKSQSVVMSLNYIQIVNSDVVMGISLMLMLVFVLNIFGGNLSFFTALIAHITICMPYVILTILPKIRQVDPNMLDAALDLGCTPSKAFVKIILPQITSGIVSALVMAFSISFDDFAVSYFTAGSSFQTLPVLIYSMARKRITPKINALFAILLVLILIMLILMNLLDVRSEKLKKKKYKIKQMIWRLS